MTKTPVQFLDLFRYYRGLPHQLAAIQQLGELIPASLLHRENEWFHTWSQAGKQPDPDWLAPALKIIKEFEGLRLEAYKCPAGIWTIGYGTTRYGGPNGGPVRKDDVITAQQAEYLLQSALFDLYAPNILHLIPSSKSWSGNQIAALISFAYNVGLAALEDSTLRKRLNAGEDPIQVVREELPKWVKVGDKTLPGLVRRRNAEVELFVGKQLQQPVASNPLPVPYFSQNDNVSGTGYRECFSSSCAMVAAFYGKVKSDDEYNKLRARYGDTTDVNAQLKTLNGLGLIATFHKDGNTAKLKNLLSQGIPVPVGWLHKGPVTAPSGGGHWSVVIATEGEKWIVNDPNGQADLINGGYTPDTNGHGERYSFKNFNPRWEADGPSTGWYLKITKA